MKKIKTLPFTPQQVNECLCVKHKTVIQLMSELVKKMGLKMSKEARDRFQEKLKIFLLSLVSFSKARSAENEAGEMMFAII